jgi:hypothetical protein
MKIREAPKRPQGTTRDHKDLSHVPYYTKLLYG